eukprot:TRINITY_DN1849_c0_g1_i3.p1 TRINITY_DN1849_c0_g1~~TRINITY_DN1849_c0_g1_i3.p1  ORF type:complete len:324 (+),score=55.80 TRINITY_DN1849_c0_g1_i3:121-1092(+)
MLRSLVGSEMCIRDSINAEYGEHQSTNMTTMTLQQTATAGSNLCMTTKSERTATELLSEHREVLQALKLLRDQAKDPATLGMPTSVESDLASFLSGADLARGHHPIAHVPFAEELLALSQDAMAQVDPGSGVVLWSNHLFDQLTLRVGLGDAQVGQRILAGELLQCSPQGNHYTVCTINSPGMSSLKLHSTTQLLKHRLLWVIGSFDTPTSVHLVHADIGTTTDSTTPDCTTTDCTTTDCTTTDCTTTDCTLLPSGPDPPYLFRGNQQTNSDQHPSAADHPDPKTRVGAVMHGKQRTMLLWRQYGRKSVFSKTQSGSEAAECL